MTRRRFLKLVRDVGIVTTAVTLGALNLSDAIFADPPEEVKKEPDFFYDHFLDMLTGSRYNVFPVAEWEYAQRDDRVNIALRHDLDFVPRYGFRMTELDKEHGVRSTTYLRISLQYNIMDVIPFYQDFEANGFEVGYHYEDMDNCETQVVTPCVISSFKNNLAFLRQYVHIHSVSPHGGDGTICLWRVTFGLN